MIRILQVIGKLDIGGAENMLISWYGLMDNKRFHFDFVVYEDGIGDYEDFILKQGSRVFHTAKPGSHPMRFKNQFKKILKNGRYDIVHSHTLLSSGIVLECAAKCKIKGRIAHSHSTQNRVKESLITQVYENLMREKILKYATDFLACGEEAGSYLFGNSFFKKKGKIINNAIDSELYSFDESKRGEERKKLGIDENSMVIGSISRFHPVKNHQFMVELFNEVHKINPTFKLLLVGDGTEFEKIQKRVDELGLKQDVFMTGKIMQPASLYSAIDVYLMPSFHEGFPLSLLESQANGLTALVSDTITKELSFMENICYLSIQNVQSWKNLILSFSSHRRENLIKNTNYDLKTSINQLILVYNKFGCD